MRINKLPGVGGGFDTINEQGNDHHKERKEKVAGADTHLQQVFPGISARSDQLVAFAQENDQVDGRHKARSQDQKPKKEGAAKLGSCVEFLGDVQEDTFQVLFGGSQLKYLYLVFY